VLAIRRGLTGEDKSSSKKDIQGNGSSKDLVSGQLEKSLAGSTDSLEVPVMSKTTMAEPKDIGILVPPQRTGLVNGSAEAGAV
jgi:hypothetical protein